MTSVILPNGKRINWSPAAGPLLPLSSLSMPWTHLNSASFGEHWLSHPLTCEGHASIKGLLPPLYSGCTDSVSAVSHAQGRYTVYCQEFSCVLFRSPFMAAESLPSPVPQRPSLSGILWVEQRGVGQAGGDKDIAFSYTQRQPCPPPTFSSLPFPIRDTCPTPFLFFPPHFY